MKNVPAAVFAASLAAAAACTAVPGAGSAASAARGFHSYAGGRDETSFSCRLEDGAFRFRFAVADASVHAVPDFTAKRDLERGDRVEVFFSSTPDMSAAHYYCAEIDPLGRVLDYKAAYPRVFDYTWGFRTLERHCEITPDGYTVEGSVSAAELKSLGIDPREMWLGVFRADYDSGENLVDWHSLVPHGPGEADFHRPCALFRFRADE